MKERNHVYFEDLPNLTQEVIIDLLASIVEARMTAKEEQNDAASCDLREVEQRPPQCLV